jgi:hypothetical protein
MIGDAILAMNPALRFSIDGEVKTEADYNNITWFNGKDPQGSAFEGTPDGIPSWRDVQAKILVMEDERDATKYQRDRKSERRTRMPLELQLEAIVEQMKVDQLAGKEMTPQMKNLLSIDSTIRNNHKKP